MAAINSFIRVECIILLILLILLLTVSINLSSVHSLIIFLINNIFFLFRFNIFFSVLFGVRKSLLCASLCVTESGGSAPFFSSAALNTSLPLKYHTTRN